MNAREGATGEGEAQNSESQGGADMRGSCWTEEVRLLQEELGRDESVHGWRMRNSYI